MEIEYHFEGMSSDFRKEPAVGLPFYRKESDCRPPPDVDGLVEDLDSAFFMPQNKPIEAHNPTEAKNRMPSRPASRQAPPRPRTP